MEDEVYVEGGWMFICKLSVQNLWNMLAGMALGA
jgi:hypothetical protein